jgi:exodeoxyribonuclease VII large subunit
MVPFDFETPNTSDAFFRLSQIGQGIANAVRESFGERSYWIVAEISDLAVRKGHCYLSLVEKPPGAAAPICEMKGIVWASSFASVSANFKLASGMELSKGMVILFKASVRFDVKWGLSLTISDIDPKYTIGQIQIERDRAVAALRSEGVYDKNRSLTFPVVAQRIAVISASDSRGYEDFMQKLVGNAYGYKFNCDLYQSQLQGDKAAMQMVEQLIGIYGKISNYDAVVIVRGGGGAVDLNCFNDVRLARAIARFPIPVITGIGHTANRSVSDEVAHADRITPTDAADYFIERMLAFENRIMDLVQSINQLAEELIMEETAKVEELANGLTAAFNDLIDGESSRLSTISMQIRDLTLSLLSNANYRMASSSVSVAQLAKGRLSMCQDRINRSEMNIKTASLKRIKDGNILIDSFQNTIKHLDPINVLKRGFSITMKDGKSIKSASDIKAGDILTTILHEGKIESHIR